MLKQTTIFSLLLFCLSLTLPASEVVIPKLSCTSKADSVLSASVPWKTGFTLTGNPAQKPKADTKVKLFHDGMFLYVGMEMLEPQMNKLVAKESNSHINGIWRNDSVEINIDSTGKAQQLAKVIIDCRGIVCDYFGLDDNLGKDSYALGNDWKSHTKVISCSKGEKSWSLELAIPLGLLYDGVQRIGQAPVCHLNIGRNRCAQYENSDLFPMSIQNHGAARLFPAVRFDQLDTKTFAWEIAGMSVKATKDSSGKKVAQATCQVVNRSPKFRNCSIRLSYVDAKGRLLGSQKKMQGALPNKLAPVQIDIPLQGNPEILRGKLLAEVCDGRGRLLCSSQLPQNLEWQTLAIKMITPWYRNNIYATMPAVDKIEAELLVKEGLGKPLTVTLTGPNGFKQEQKIAKLQAKNKITLPFANAKIGDYYLKADRLTVKIRKLPYLKGEVWLDRDNVVHVDGKEYFPIGGYGGGCKGAFTHSTAIWQSLESLQKACDSYQKNGWKMSIYPYLDETPGHTHFGTAGRQKSRMTPEQKERMRKLVEVASKHPVMFAYYLADEPEGFGMNEEWYEDALAYIQELDPYHPATITDYGMDGQRRFYRGCDILFSDCYPDYYANNITGFGHRFNYDSAVHSNNLRPTWQMVQTFDWGRTHVSGAPGRGPSYDEIREQVLSAMLGNTKAIMFYCTYNYGRFTYDMQIGTDAVIDETSALSSLLLRPTTYDITVPAACRKSVLAGSKIGKNGARAILVINTGDTPQTLTLTLNKGTLPAQLRLGGEGRTIAVKNNQITDTFLPHVPVIYLTQNAPADGIDLVATRKKIAALEAARVKPGNLAYFGPTSCYWLKQAKQNKWKKNAPKVTSSSENYPLRPEQYTALFVADGIRHISSHDMMLWNPAPTDKEPWLEVEFTKEETVGRSVLYSAPGINAPQSGKLLIPDDNGGWKEIATFKDTKENEITVTFTPVKTRKIRIQFLRDRAHAVKAQVEWELYAK